MEPSFIFTKTLAIFTLLGNVLFVLLLVMHVLWKPLFKRIMEWVGEHVLLLGFLLSAGATVGSIIYSEVVGFPACILCWIQRIFMYPLPFLFGLALVRRDRSIIPYALLLALIGGAVALYQWIKDMLALYSTVTMPCPAVSALPSCDRIYVLEFGYITIPMIALNAFVLIVVVLYAALRHKNPDRTSANGDLHVFLPNDSGSGTKTYSSHTGTVHLVDFSEKISQGLALRLPSEWVPNKPKLTPRSIWAEKRESHPFA